MSKPFSSTDGYRGLRVDIEGVGLGTIVDETPHTVGVLLDGEGCRVMYVQKADLTPND